MERYRTSTDGLEDKTWEQFCGFLKLSVEEFQAIQNELLEESLRLLAPSPLGKNILKGKTPHSFKELLKAAPLTTYEDYAQYFDLQNDSVLPEKPLYWAFTTKASGAGKWVPYTEQSHRIVLQHLMAALLLASSKGPDCVKAKPGDTIIYNVAPRPYFAGYIGHGLSEQFGFRMLPPTAEADNLEFSKRVEKGFEMALYTGADILCSLSSVLVRMGESFTQQRAYRGISRAYLHPGVLFRLTRAYLSSRLQGRHLLPKDLWRVKAVIGWGLDTSLYSEKIEYYWGVKPYELQGCTEAGILALQAWNKKGLILLPQAAFFEFISEEESLRNRQTEGYRPTTVLLDGLEVGKRYELVLTSFHGMPFLRCRVGHLIKVLAKDDPETGVLLPQVAFVGRTDGVIDLAGFTRLDEKTVHQAVHASLLTSLDWVAAKEHYDSTAVLHLYVETNKNSDETEMQNSIHKNLKALDPAYEDLESMLGMVPLRVSLLAPGTFKSYYEERRRRGDSAEQSHLSHMNPPSEALQELLRISNTAKN